jgi:hypothetical protein
LLLKYYECELIDSDNVTTEEADELKPKKATSSKEEEKGSVGLKDEKLKPKKHLKPIL